MPGQPGYPAAPPGGTGRSRVAVIVAVVAAVVLLFCGGTVAVIFYSFKRTADAVHNIPTLGPTDLPEPSTAPSPSASGDGTNAGAPQVVFEVTGDGTARIMYEDLNGLQVLTNQKLPWRAEVQVRRPSAPVLTANRDDSDNGKLACRILVDGQQVASLNRTGPSVAVVCSTYVQR
jgi:hypothetical protein